MKAIGLPAQDVRVDMPGQVDPLWYEKFQAITKFINMFDVDLSALTDGDVLVWDATAKKFKPTSI